MKKFVLGAGAALALWSGSTPAQTPAPIVPAVEPMAATPSAATSMPASPMTGDPVPLANLADYGSPFAGYAGGTGLAPARFYTEASYLLMFASDANLGTPILTNGILGQPGTNVIVGRQDTDYDPMSGFRVGFGGLIGANSVGIDVNGMFLGRTSYTTTVGPTATGVLARPFDDTGLRTENAKVIAAPGAFRGAFTIDHSLQAWGTEVNPFYRVVQGNIVSLDVITGFRYFSANERTNIYDSTTVLPGGTTAFNGLGLGNGAIIVTNDKFSTRNNFYGANFGGRVSFTRGAFFLDATGKVAIGGVHQTLNVDGSTTLLSGGGLVGATTTPGGFLANPTLTRTVSENRFAVLPEGNLTLGYQVSSWLNVFAGYQVMYLSNMARPQEQISRSFASSNIPTVPTYSARGLTSRNLDLASDDLFLHGFSFGLTITY